MKILTLVAVLFLRPAPLIGLLSALATLLGAVVSLAKLVTGRKEP